MAFDFASLARALRFLRFASGHAVCTSTGTTPPLSALALDAISALSLGSLARSLLILTVLAYLAQAGVESTELGTH